MPLHVVAAEVLRALLDDPGTAAPIRGVVITAELLVLAQLEREFGPACTGRADVATPLVVDSDNGMALTDALVRGYVDAATRAGKRWVIFTTYISAAYVVLPALHATERDLLIVDEAHHLATRTSLRDVLPATALPCSRPSSTRSRRTE